jgi:pimeloyl-ACP methyl ester carboxylesterase
MTGRARKTLEIGTAVVSYGIAGDGPTVLMIQGVGVSGSGWGPQVAALSNDFRTITIDNRGLGDSTPGAEALTIERMAADALAIMDAERAARFHVVGHSMGGLIAQHLAVVARTRVISLSLLCTFGNGKDGATMAPAMMVRAIRTRVGTRAMRRRAMLELVVAKRRLDGANREGLAAEMAALFGHDLADHPPIAMKQLKAMSAYGATQGLGTLGGLPTLVVSGAHDLVARPVLGRALAADIPGARYVEFADAAHALPIECAADVNDLLRAHLEAAERSEEVR